MELKPQDLLVVFKVAANPRQRWTCAAPGEALSMSASEVHASVKRSVVAGLAAARRRGDGAPVRPALLEFATHGVICLEAFADRGAGDILASHDLEDALNA
jgi:hypothetical protein